MSALNQLVNLSTTKVGLGEIINTAIVKIRPSP